MKIQYYSRCNNDALFNMAQELCPTPINKIEGFNSWDGAAHYLYHILDAAEEWAVNIDIDCFMTYPPAVEGIINEMKKKGYTYSGVPDGGVIPFRSGSWCTAQSFFTIFNAKAIRDKKNELGLTWQDIEKFRYESEWNRMIPPMVTGNWDANKYEPDSGLFFYLFKHGSPLFLEGMTMADGISTALIWKNRTVAYHSWYARDFETVESGHIRILNLFNKAKLDSLVNAESDRVDYFKDPLEKLEDQVSPNK